MRDIIVKAVSFIQVKLGEIVRESQWYQGLNKHFDNIFQKDIDFKSTHLYKLICSI